MDVAIVIGNQAYDHVESLANPRHDAAAIADLLRSFGFAVFEGYDLDKEEIEELLRRATLNIDEGARVFFYFAGHGIQLGRRNYLLTREARFEDVHALPFESVTLDRVSTILSARASVQILMLDACRDNPVAAARMTADVGAELYEARQGFEVFTPPLDTLLAYSTAPGAIALDGEPGENSPYTSAVVELFSERPEDDVMSILSAVRARVYEMTQARQVTWESSTLVQPLVLRRPGGLFVRPAAAPGIGASQTTGATLTSVAALERMVDLSSDILPIIGNGPELDLVEPPSHGQVQLTKADDGTPQIRYSPLLDERPAERATGAPGMNDSFRLALSDGGATRSLLVELTLEPDPCDVQAGDLLDLQGVGLYRFASDIDGPRAEAACREAVARAPNTGRFHHQLARALEAQGRQEEAVTLYERAIDLGHVRAKQALGFLLLAENLNREVFDIPLDLDRAHDLLERAIAAGDPFAMHTRGKRLLELGETAEDRTRGFELLSQAIELGHTYSMNELGVYFLDPDTADRQPARGRTYLEAAFARGDIYGAANLGTMWMEGWEGAPADPDRAANYLRIATEGGHPTAPNTIGLMIVRGQLDEHGPADALASFDTALERGDAWGGANGARVILQLMPPGTWPRSEAAARLGKALAARPSEAAIASAESLLAELEPTDLDAGTQTILAELGDSLAVDGRFGPMSRRALHDRALAVGLLLPDDTDAEDRLRLAGRIFFRERPYRIDVF